MFNYTIEAEKGTEEKYASRFTCSDKEGTIMWTTRSLFLFQNASEAETAGQRAVTMLESTGMFPNMCKPF